MRRSIQLFVFGLVAAMVLVTLAVATWLWDALAQAGGVPDRKLVIHSLALMFIPLWLGLGALAIKWMLTRPGLQIADDSRRVAENSLVAAALLAVGVHLWTAAAAVLGEPPGREFGVRLVEAVTGIYFIINANFAAKTSPPAGWPDPGRWIRATLRTGWVGVAAGVVILTSAIAAPVDWMIWVVGGSTLAYVAASVLNHLKFRKPVQT